MHHLSWNTYSEVLQNRASILCALIQNAVGIDVCVISDAFSRIPFKVDVLILPFKLFHSHKKCSNSKLFLCTTRALFDLSWHIHGCCTRKKNIAWKVHFLEDQPYLLLEKRIFVARKKYLLLEEKKCCSRKKYCFSKTIFVAWEKNTCCSVSLRPQGLIWWRRRDENGPDLQNYVSRSGHLCRKIAPKRIFLTRLHPKGAHFKILHRLLISKTLNWQQRTHRNQSLSRNWGGKLLRKCYLHTESDDITAELNDGTKNFGGK